MRLLDSRVFRVGRILGLVLIIEVTCVAAQRGDAKYSPNDDGREDWTIKLMVPGRPQRDYPVRQEIPKSSFTCSGKMPGYYADFETDCQVFRVCLTGARFGYQSFLCPNGTLFNQVVSVCDWWMNVNCAPIESTYNPESQRLIKPGRQMMQDVKKMLTYPMRNPYTVANPARLTMQVYNPPLNQMYPPPKTQENLEEEEDDTYFAASTARPFYVPPPRENFASKLGKLIQASGQRSESEKESQEDKRNDIEDDISAEEIEIVGKDKDDKVSYHSWIVPNNGTIALSPQNIFPFLQAKANLDKDWTNASITLETYVTNNTVRSRTIIKRLKNPEENGEKPISQVDLGSAVNKIIEETGKILNKSSYPTRFQKQIASTYIPPLEKSGKLVEVSTVRPKVTYLSPTKSEKQIRPPPKSEKQIGYSYPAPQMKFGQLKAAVEEVRPVYRPPTEKYLPVEKSGKLTQPSSELLPPGAEVYEMALNDNITFTLKIPYPILNQIMENKKNSDWNHLEVLHTGDSNYLVLAKKRSNGKNSESVIPLGRLIFDRYFNNTKIPRMKFEQLRELPKKPINKSQNQQSGKMYSSTYNTRTTSEDYRQNNIEVEPRDEEPSIYNRLEVDEERSTKRRLGGEQDDLVSTGEVETPRDVELVGQQRYQNQNEERSGKLIAPEPMPRNGYRSYQNQNEERSGKLIAPEPMPRSGYRSYQNQNEVRSGKLIAPEPTQHSGYRYYQNQNEERSGKLIAPEPTPHSGYRYCAGSNNPEHCNNPYPKITFPGNGAMQPLNRADYTNAYTNAYSNEQRSGKLIMQPYPLEEQRIIKESVYAQLQRQPARQGGYVYPTPNVVTSVQLVPSISDNYRIVMQNREPYFVQRPILGYGLPQMTSGKLIDRRVENFELEEPETEFIPVGPTGYPRVRPAIPFTF